MSADDSALALQLQSSLVQDMANRVARAFEDVQARIRRRQNASCAVNNLPAEILAYIFQLAVAPVFIGRSSDDTRPPGDVSYHTTLQLAATCSHWRAMSLDNPFLWSCFDTATPANYVELAMRRNKSVPLSILGPLPTTTPPELFRLAMDNVHRIRALEAVAPGDALSALFGRPAFVLSELTCLRADSEEDEQAFTLPMPEAPNLRSLTLYQCIPDLGQPPRLALFHKLTTVVIQIHYSIFLDGFCERLLALCRVSPNLESVYVTAPSYHPISYNLLTPLGSVEPARMSKLRSLKTQIPLEISLDLLPSLSLPPHMLDFAIGTHRLEVDKDEHVRLWNRERIPTTIFLRLKELRFTLSLSHELSLSGTDTIGRIPDNFYVGFCFRAPNRMTGIVDNVLDPVVSYLADVPMPDLKHLDVVQRLHPKTPPDSETRKRHIAEIGASVHRLLSTYPNITSLTLRFGSSGILKGLRAHLREPGLNPSLFPFIEKCTIQVGHGIKIPTILGFVRLLLPNQIGELHLEGTVFDVKSDADALDFVQEKLPRLAREVWVTGSAIFVSGGRLQHRNITAYWQKAEECPLKSGDPESVPPLEM